MSIDLASSNRRKVSQSPLSQSDNYSYSRRSLKQNQEQTQLRKRTMSFSEEISGDILTDLSSAPLISLKQDNNKRNRRYSELKSLSESCGSNSERRNSTPQINFSSLLPNPFRSNKHHHHHHKSTTKDETNTTVNNTSSSLYHDMMTMKSEPSSSSKLTNTMMNGSRTNLSVSNDRLSSIVPEDSSSSLFILDVTHPEPRSTETFMLELQTSLCVGEIYREHFFEYFHTNYCGEFEQEGPFIASLRCFSNTSSSIATDTNVNCQARAIIRVPSHNYDVSVMVNGANEDSILQVLFNKVHLSGILTCKTIGDPKANEKIYLFDKSNDERQNCKIGFIHQRSDQNNEYDIFSNDSLSNELSDFLQMLADRVRLKGFNKYRGDLDIKEDLHGEYSYYTQYKNREIMFNVAPIIPSTKANGQCIERKGLVGNAFVCIVFQETDTEFIPDYIAGKVTQVYITVQPIQINDELYYKIGIWHRNDVTSIIDPPGGIYKYDKSFRDYFLTLLLNAINVAIESPRLRSRVVEQRQRLKQEELRKLSQNLSIGQVLDASPDIENITPQVEMRSNFRADNFVSNTNQSLNDSIIPNSGRTSPSIAKKKGLSSRILGVFRSGSISSPSPSLLPTLSIPTNIDIAPASPYSPPSSPSFSGQTIITSGTDSIKRAPSVKAYTAPARPPPPVPPRRPIARSASNSSVQTPPLTSPSQNVPNSINSTNDKPMQPSSLPPQHIILNAATVDVTARSRSNSSPGDSVTTTKPHSITVSRISEEVDYTSSSGDEDSDDELSDDDKLEHRQTLTEPAQIISPNTNS